MPTREEAVTNLREALPHILIAFNMAKLTHPRTELGVLGTNEDGSGSVVARFDGDEFLRDLEAALGPGALATDDVKLGPWEPHTQYPNNLVRNDSSGENIAALWPEGEGTSMTWCWRIEGRQSQTKDCNPDKDQAMAQADAVLKEMGYTL